MWESESESVSGRDYGNGVLSNTKHGVKTDGFEQKGQSWYELFITFSNIMCLFFFLSVLLTAYTAYRYVETDIPSDLLVQIGDVSFHLHKVHTKTLLKKFNVLHN